MEPDATNKATSDTIPHECVRKDRTYDISTGSSRITGDEKGLEKNYFRDTDNHTILNRLETQYCTNKYVRNIREQPQISYSEAVNRGLTNNTLRSKYP